MSDSVEQDKPILEHLLELRSRLLRIVIAILLVFLALYPFSDQLFAWLSGPLRAVLPENASMIAVKVASPFLIPMKLAFISAIFIAVPYILYQIWAFVAPGLYHHERRLVWPLLFSSTVLFYLGAVFAYFVVFPLVFGFFARVAPEGVLPMTDIGEYLDFVLTLFFAFGAAFEVPIAVILLVYTGATTRQSLKDKRPYVVVGAFVIGMLLTPPDVLSQVLLAVPICLLYEVGILMSGWFTAKVRTDTEQPAGSE